MAAVGLSLLLHGAPVGVVLLGLPVDYSGALRRPTEAISVSIVDSSVLESRAPDEQLETAAHPASVAAQPGEPDPVELEKIDTSPPGEKAKVADRRDEAVASPAADADAPDPVEAAPQNETQASPSRPLLSEQPAPVLVPDPLPIGDRDLAKTVLDAVENDQQTAEKQRQERESPDAPAAVLEKREPEARQASAEEEPTREQRRHDKRPRSPARRGGAENRSNEGSAKSSGRVAASQGDVAGYAARVRAQVAAHKPAGSGVRGTVTIRFGISKSGAVSFAAIARSSGHPAIDSAALSAVHRAAPFPSPPSGGSVTFAVPFTFQ